MKAAHAEQRTKDLSAGLRQGSEILGLAREQHRTVAGIPAAAVDPVEAPHPPLAAPEEVPDTAAANGAAIDLPPEHENDLPPEFHRDEVLVLVEELADVGAENQGLRHLEVIEDRLAVHRALLLRIGDEQLEVVEDGADLELPLEGTSGKLIIILNHEPGELRVRGGEIEPGPGSDPRLEGVEIFLLAAVGGELLEIERELGHETPVVALLL